jgi:hypothetical protein
VQLAGKLAGPARLASVAAGLLVHIVDELSCKRFLVDTGASYSILPHRSSAPASGPRLFGLASQLIPCWGERFQQLQFQGQVFSWPFLLAAVDFPIIAVDSLRQHALLVDPANSRLVNGQGQAFPTSLHSSPPTASVVTGLHPQHTLASTVPATVTSTNSAPASPSCSSPSGAPFSSPSLSPVSGSAASAPATSSSAMRGVHRDILEAFPEVVNVAKRLPEVHHDVVHHIVTVGPPIAAKFHRLDGEKLEAAKKEFKQL